MHYTSIIFFLYSGMKHVHTRCHGCNDSQIAGLLWQCRICFEYYLCTPCYMLGKHSMEHTFLRIDTHDVNRRWAKRAIVAVIHVRYYCTWYYYVFLIISRVLVPARARSLSLQIMGIFPGSKVTRGHNWKWGNQDGTMHTLLHRLSTVCVTIRLDIIIIIIWSIFKVCMYVMQHTV